MPHLRWFLLLLGTCAASTYTDNVCDDPKVSSLPFCDASLSVDARVSDLVTRIPLQQAVGLQVNKASAAPSVNVPSYEWWNEALHGVALSPGVTFKSPLTAATSFPQVISTAASFNRTLFYQIAEAISTEARAFYNEKKAGLTFWTPNVNIFRDPRWGRGQETPGEDPYLTGEYAVTFVRGLQGEAMEEHEDGDENKFLKISSCCKHFSAYSQEVPRHRNNAMVTKQDQADTYFPAFEDCVKRGHVSSIMCSYNAVNGIPSCADKGLLTDLVRGEWKFDGYITSDCEAVADVIYRHHYTQSPEQTCATTLDAGMDLNCGEFLRQHLPNAVEQGIVSAEMVHNALKNQFRVLMRLGMFERGSQPFANITKDAVDTAAHRKLALEAARQSVVLLKNEENTLPLDVGAFSKDGSLALIGPHFNASTALLGNYFGKPSHIVTPLEGVSSYVPNVAYSLGCKVSGEVLPDFDEAIEVTKKAERVVVFMGLDQSQEREEIDRYTIKLPGFQIALLNRLLTVALHPIVLVIISGGSLDLSVYKDHPKVGAIVFGGYLGQAGGQGLADVLFGKYNPAGRLPQTFYDSDYVNTVSIYDMHMRPTLVTGNPGRTYRFFGGAPVFEFGFGLSYTTYHKAWSLEPPNVLDAAILTQQLQGDARSGSHSCVASFEITVTNLGDVDGEDVILIYAEPPRAGEGGRPLKSLVAFERTALVTAGQTASANFCLEAKAFALADEQGNWVVEQGNWTIHVDTLQHKVNVQASVAREPALVQEVTRKPLPRGAEWA
ncbi:Beta-xylosidase/alpha-L-arabinofuranosidase 2 [Phytophthora fragariae]|uniref:Beta-xylosidase/alpha-L-arabinofuranosidase 2 n=1 Tax=Phytophthora fragariae TaxID=53985 RepID=A0A6A3YLT7_9STRA|nr:Beta-xylosidase/alpha-L-arabinofuranosidase 2 [Phytophthora fragariae]KAE8941784.1 Beta-xylosidase/alpha-L-arabinofuranosidase 2 [Phytophthora fragariae]KAE9017947.1 Beta-xylosidase/alpha-L-arabinofuranosidase 2 [Phytophthora fragariae]KAE9121154.1 Beta-xylosidase/alpha-L-arabinofuranosidase 2 [Phytophthora fragariae]KAE9122405.1 Beta-xylosidase/alpha-L-arabinofuranosidase 2 [Phytophthora fragariae]